MEYIRLEEMFIEFKITPKEGTISEVLKKNEQIVLLNKLISCLPRKVNSRNKYIKIFYLKDYNPDIYPKGSDNWPLLIENDCLVIRAVITIPRVEKSVFIESMEDLIEKENFKVIK